MWRKAIILVLGVVTIPTIEFHPNDESDYIDEPDDEVSLPSDSTMTLNPEPMEIVTVHGEIKKLMGQSVFIYEDCTISSKPTLQNKKASKMKKMQRKRDGSANDSLLVVSKPTRTVPSLRSPRPKTKTVRVQTTEAVYSINIRGWPQQKVKQGVIAKIVGAHDIVQDERPTRTPPFGLSTDPGLARSPHGRTIPGYVYQYGGMRPNDERRYLLTVPQDLKRLTTRPPRPTPTTPYSETTYKYTRRHKKHPNCTHSYYECLFMCFNAKGYKVSCPWDTTPPRPEPARLNFTGMFWALSSPIAHWDTDKLFSRFKEAILKKGYRDCKCTTTTTTTTTKSVHLYYDDAPSNNTGKIIAKCWVCGLTEYGIPHDAHCSDNFDAEATGLALAEKNSYRKYCRYMDEVPLWFNKSDPFSVFGPWTGGCSTRYLDLSGLYTQRTCRSVVEPAVGHHYLSRRMAMLELALREDREGCVVSPMASLVPFSRSVSLYARLHVCVCVGNFCNHAPRRQTHTALRLVFSLNVFIWIRSS